jgi:hypothetical protein
MGVRFREGDRATGAGSRMNSIQYLNEEEAFVVRADEAKLREVLHCGSRTELPKFGVVLTGKKKNKMSMRSRSINGASVAAAAPENT